MYVKEISDAREWEDFTQSIPTATFYHSLKWKEVIQRSFPHRAMYLVVKDSGGKVVGVSPGFITESLHTKIYDSTPHSDYGGPLIETSHIPKASAAILDHLRHLSSSQGLAYAKFLVREKALQSHLRSQTSCTESNEGVMEIDLTITPPRFIWNNIFSSNRRKKFKQMERRDFQAREARTRSDLRVFYNLYLSNMKHIGAHPRPYSFMENVWSTLFPSCVRIWILEGKKPVAAKLFFKFERKSFSAYVGIERDQQMVHSNRHASSAHASEYLTWTEIKKAEEEGFSCVSLGTTPNDSNSSYFEQKSSMGCTFYPQLRIWTPLCSSGQILVRIRYASGYMGKTVRSLLPVALTRIFESKLDVL